MKEKEWIDKMLTPHLRAGWSRRLISFIYDLIYLFLVLFVISFITTMWMIATAEPPAHIEIWELRDYLQTHHPGLFFIDRLIKAIAIFFYFFLLPILSSDHRTLGMLTFGLSLMNEQGEEITRKQYLLRETYKWLLFPGFLMVLGKEKRALHDRLSKCYLVLN